jgi:PAS domain S-box-containing protein
MRTKILRRLRDIHTGVFTGMVIVLSVTLTTGLNAFFSWASGTAIKPITMLFATFDAILIPLIIAPPVLRLFKRAASTEDSNVLLQTEIAERKRAELAAEERSAQMQAINELALACAAATSDADLPRLIADRFRSLSGNRAVSISTFAPQTSQLTIRYVSIDGSLFSAFTNLLGRNLIGMTNPVSPNMLQEMLTNGITVTDSISDVTFGAIPKAFDAVAQAAFGRTQFTAMSLCYDGQLWGTTVAVSEPDGPPFDLDLARTFANIAAMAMQRQSVERSLQQRQEHLQAIISNLPLIFFVLDAQGIFQVSEGKGLAMLGLRSGEVVGKSAFQMYQDYPLVVENLRKALAGEITYAIHDMGALIYDVYYTPLVDTGGQRAGVIGVAVDVTDRHHVEVEREKLIAELGAKNYELERFTYTVSHDLKAPLITIRGFLGFLEKDALAGEFERMRGDMKRITAATDKMERLLSELLELSRIGRLMNPPEEIPFDEIVQDALQLVSGSLGSCDVCVSVGAELPSVYGDRVRLVEVMQNLLDNACKFRGDQKPPHIEIGADVQNGQAVFYVRDNGIGIAPEFHEKIFGLFDKLDPLSPGTGIGLALVKRIIEVHHGRIWVESDGLGHGATFYFTIPNRVG